MALALLPMWLDNRPNQEEAVDAPDPPAAVIVQAPVVQAAVEPPGPLVEAPEAHVGEIEVIDGITYMPAGDVVEVSDPEIISFADAPPELSAEDMIRERWAGTGDETTMVRIAQRESCGVVGCAINCAADNRSSSAAGAFQILTTLHAGRIAGLGYTTAQMYECGPNIDVAWHMYLDSGTGPWRLTR